MNFRLAMSLSLDDLELL